MGKRESGEKLVSIIVPIYNTEKYLRECVDSILRLTYDNFEVILVDDGSTDTSASICDEYECIDKRVKVIHKPNNGLSSARNAGLGISTGDHICFVDSDDTVTSDYVQKLLGALELYPEADFAFCDFKDRLRPELSSQTKAQGNMVILDKNGFSSFFSDHQSREYVDAVVAWNKLYKRELITGLNFPVGRWHEDEFFANKIIKKMNRCVFVTEKLYVYRENEAGITGNKNRFDIRHLDAIDAYRDRIIDAANEGNYELAKKTALNGLEKLCMFFNELDDRSQAYRKTKYTVKKKYLNYYVTAFKHISLKKKVKYFIGLVNYRLLKMF